MPCFKIILVSSPSYLLPFPWSVFTSPQVHLPSVSVSELRVTLGMQESQRPSTDLRSEDANPILKMENKQTVGTSDTQENSMMKPIDQRAHIKGRSDILTRRLKNRERQRRYRARKRLEAETKKSSVVRDMIPITPPEEPQSNGNHNFMTRVYCNRDWKRDARRASQALRLEEVTPNGSIDHISKLTSESEAACLTSGKAELTQEREIQSGSPGDNETPRTVLSRRDWKAEARRKKT